ncbi:MAG: nucleotidyltransferase domain-containing protein, partial [Myxococcales bacterium]|nr:nucleotidyltransferase domain-containing protein [Myxococcales bacterium]
LSDLQKIAGPELSSVIIHGSVARAEWVEGKSDIDVLVVLAGAPRAMLSAMGDCLAVARAAARIDAMILVESEISRASDVFPLFYADIREHHIVLFGSDPFASLTIESAHLRLRIEQELRDVAIRMRRVVTDARGEPVALGHAVARQLRRIRFPLHTMLRLMKIEAGHELMTVLEKAGRKLDVDSVAFRRVYERPEAAFDALVTLLDRAIDAVDRLEPGAARG